ncbi:MAG TPA: flagellar hook-length control protein FliK [Pseudolabrys sp.]|nr:flagellar hook-length control protein FliK [Pseudolabrys sp.]
MSSVSLQNLAAALAEAAAAPQLRLRPGDVVNAIVLSLLDDATLKLQLPSGTIEVAADVPLAPGTPVQVSVQGTTEEPSLVITPLPNNAQAPTQPQAPVSVATSISISAPAATPTLPTAAPTPQQQQSGQPVALAPSLTDAATPAPTTSAPQTISIAQTVPPPQASAAQVPAAAVQKLAAALVGDAATRQDSVAPLYADLQAVLTQPDLPIPPKIVALAQQLFGLRLDVGSKTMVTASEIKTAVLRSGLVGEPEIAVASTAPAAVPQSTPADLKSVLVALRLALQGWVDAEEPAMAALVAPLVAKGDDKPAARASVPMPPFRNAPTSAQAAASTSLSSTMSMRELAQHLLNETDAAIARQTLLQIASLSRDQKQDAKFFGPDNNALTLEIPLATNQGTAVAQMRVERDASGPEGEAMAPVWRVNFSIDVEPVGPVHAMIALAQGRTAVTLKAERPDSARELSAGLPLLEAALRGADLEPGSLQCQAGAPLPQPVEAGMFLDRAT